MTYLDPVQHITTELSLPKNSVQAVIHLLEEGNTIPFIARYRKEATGNLDEVQIRNIHERLEYVKELIARQKTIISSIESQGKLTDSLRQQILSCTVKTTLEDLYLPYKPKRRTRAMIAREKGLEPLALKIMELPLSGDPVREAEQYINAEKGVSSADEALQGARDIVAEMISENVEIRSTIREEYFASGMVVSKVVEGKDKEATKFEQYYNFSERVAVIPSHRYLAIRRGEREEILQFSIEIDPELAIAHCKKQAKWNSKSPYAKEMAEAIEDSCKRLLLPSVETDVRVDLKMKSDRAAVEIFAENLRNLLLSAPLGTRSVIGIDPGLRTGCKCAVVDDTGKFLGGTTLYLTQGDRSMQQASRDLLGMISAYKPYAIAIGNGTGGRETEAFVRKSLSDANLQDLIVVQVNEAGASVYSASDIAREEFPELDLTVRGAISIARRLQDPLAELVKIDPKAIGVGQYQHDVLQTLLQDKLGEVVESCVNHVGVEVNTASAPLLSYVAGIGPSLATKIVKFREDHGPFKTRKQLMEVSGFGPRTFEQAAGFLRLRGGSNPLDASAVHPERYALVEMMAKDLGAPLQELIANTSLIQRIQKEKYISTEVGELTLQDIMDELKKPGRDPRAVFERPCFRDDVHSIKDLKPGMKLDGIATNVTAFGAFVDIGVHQDGLVHVSELTDRYIKDPSEVVKAGDRIKVTVIAVDVERNRITLSAKQNPGSKPSFSDKKDTRQKEIPKRQGGSSFSSSPFANL